MNKKDIVSKIMPAEWDKRVNTVLMAYPAPHTDWEYMLEEARTCFDNIIRALVEQARLRLILIGDKDVITARKGLEGLDFTGVAIIDLPYNDTWARDFGMLSVEKNGNIEYLDYKFNGWGLKFPWAQDNEICTRLASVSDCFKGKLTDARDFVLEGGSIESDGMGTLMTTASCLLSPYRNPALNRHQIEERLKKNLGAQRVLWLNNGELKGDDTDGHIDTLARFVNPSAIVYVRCSDTTDNHYDSLYAMEKELQGFTMADGSRYELIPLPLPLPIFNEKGERLPATYANFLITPRAVLVPIYGQADNDREALETIGKLFPEHQIIGIDCNALIKQHGSLHCVTMQII